jgi:hypothetical protein
MMPCISLTVQDVGSEEVDIMPGTPQEESQSDIVFEIPIRERESMWTDVNTYDGEAWKVRGQKRMKQ